MFTKSSFKGLPSAPLPTTKTPIFKKVMLRKIQHEIRLYKKRKQKSSRTSSRNSSFASNTSDVATDDIGTLWKIVPVWISTSKYFITKRKVNMVIDEGASRSLMDSKLAKEIGFRGQTIRVQRQSICEGDPVLLETCSQGTIYAKPVGKTDIYSIDVFTIKHLSKSTTPISPLKLKKKFASLRTVNLPQPADGPSQILLGFDHQHLIRVLWTYATLPHEPYCAEYLWGPAVLYHPDSSVKAKQLPRSDESFV